MHTLLAPICYLPPQNCAKSHSGNRTALLSGQCLRADQNRKAPEIKPCRPIRRLKYNSSEKLVF
ncbi:hypothetical protein DA456_21265 [Pseudomonas syringae pv. atrofaciens]|uniref:Uncharacterized protein n=1 Tax=Pseudomonas syringae pv. atrofaciens TaxID=192087 RepID=A0AAD0IDV2_PSESX|nr:hypothetical protein DA456_21265 [Pseudomonas syringae pv. atrofaciens]